MRRWLPVCVTLAGLWSGRGFPWDWSRGTGPFQRWHAGVLRVPWRNWFSSCGWRYERNQRLQAWHHLMINGREYESENPGLIFFYFGRIYFDSKIILKCIDCLYTVLLLLVQLKSDGCCFTNVLFSVHLVSRWSYAFSYAAVYLQWLNIL